ncbi:histidine acid phosphatase [Astrocystis sublimbata]|nr:histidine acid phosphatase [Astrocystis sublimbata]
MRSGHRVLIPAAAVITALTLATAAVDLNWHPPSQTSINNLTTALHGDGIYGFIFDSSHTPDDVYGTYNWCHMPHVRKTEYVRPEGDEFELVYVEVIQRHHKRTPYAANAFPVEPYHWDCADEGLYYYGASFGSDADTGATSLDSASNPEPNRPAHGFWKGFTSAINPFVPSGWIGSCQFPQITSGGLDDSFVHGADIYGVYGELLNFLPSRPPPQSQSQSQSQSVEEEEWRQKVVYRVTNNVITSQVAGMVIAGTWGGVASSSSVPLLIQAAGIDSLEPQYSCPLGKTIFNGIKSPSTNAAWAAHLSGAQDLYAALDKISGVPATDEGFHESFDHYFDNLSARQCHAKPFPCKIGAGEGGKENTTALDTEDDCVDQKLANAVYRLGQWEYSHLYRDDPQSLAASVASYGVWIAELAAHLRAAVAGEEGTPLYLHNFAHDGSVSRVLSILQIDVMVWPGMGSEVVFELYKKRKGGSSPQDTQEGSTSGFYVRVLFGGKVLRSSNPSLGAIDMLPVETLLAYFDGLVGKDASLVLGKCDGTIKM